jgi:hypothetical protein
MWQDPIVAETRALRDEYARQFNYDADAIFEDIMAKQASHPERMVSLPPRKVGLKHFNTMEASLLLMPD